jgi:hypothetical protein
VIVLLADSSGGMLEHGKIQALNRAIRRMLDRLAGFAGPSR